MLGKDGPIAAHGKGRAQGLCGRSGAAGDRDQLFCNALLFEAHRLFHRDLAEGVHRHLDVPGLHPGAVRADTDLHVSVDDAFDADENFHGAGDGASGRRSGEGGAEKRSTWGRGGRGRGRPSRAGGRL